MIPLGALPIDLAQKGAIRRLFYACQSLAAHVLKQGIRNADKHDMAHRHLRIMNPLPRAGHNPRVCQAYYISVGSVELPFSIKTLAERHIAIGPLGISAFANGVETRAPTLTSLPRNLFVGVFNGINTTAYGAIGAGLGAAPPPIGSVGGTLWGYVAPVTLEFK